MVQTTTVFYAVFLFVLTIFFEAWRPGGIRSGWPAAVMLLIAVPIGIVSLSEMKAGLSSTWNCVLTMTGLVSMALVLRQAGYFEWAILHLVRISRRSGRSFMLWLCLYTSLVTVIFTPFAAMIVLIPTVIHVLRALKLRQRAWLPYVVAIGLMSGMTSWLFPASNPLNLLVAERFQISFLTYLMTMSVPYVAAVGLGTMILLAWYYTRLPATLDDSEIRHPRQAIRAEHVIDLSWVVLAFVIGAYAVGSWYRVPEAFIVIPAALCLMLAARNYAGFEWKPLWASLPIPATVFFICTSMLLYGTFAAGMVIVPSDWLATGWSDRSAFTMVVGAGVLSAVLSGAVNQFPAALIATEIWLDSNLEEAVLNPILYAGVIGANFGSQLSIFGSLATMTWVAEVRKVGTRVRLQTFLVTGLVLSLPVLLLVLCVLYGWMTAMS